jgi:hypothetical protein
MKRILIIIFVVLFFIALSIWLFIYLYNTHSEKQQAASSYHLTREEISLIHDGDLILRHGYGIVSDIIVQRLDENYDISHCAIACKDSNGIFVIHSVSQSLSPYDGVQSQELAPFIHDSKENSVIVVRYRSKVPGKDGSVISKRAKDYLNKRIPFDHSFDINDSSTFYCQELPYKCILNEFGDDIFMDHYNKRKDHLRFDTFLDTSRFIIILNHHLRMEKDHCFHNLSVHNLLNFRHSDSIAN